MKFSIFQYIKKERIAMLLTVTGIALIATTFVMMTAPPQYQAIFLTPQNGKNDKDAKTLPELKNVPLPDGQKPEKKSLRLLFVGDLMSQGTQIQAAMIGKDGSAYDYRPMLRHVAPVIQQADLAFGNLEFTTPGKPPYTGYPHFRSPDAAIDAINWAGFDVMVTANNHVNDGGIVGINHTIDMLRKNNIHQTGSFKNQEEKDIFSPLFIYKDGFKIALINYTMHTNSITTPQPARVNRTSPELVRKEIEVAKQYNPDCIIAFMHWGVEYQLNENAQQRELAHKMHQWGADLVIGGHPHVVEPVKWEKIMKNGQLQNCLTAYSLGNFMSDQPYANTEGGLMLELSIRKGENGNCVIEQPNYIPVYRHTEWRRDGRKRFQMLPVSSYETDQAMDMAGMSPTQRVLMRNFVDALRTRLAPHGIEERKLTTPQYQPVVNHNLEY
ncbi:MAG: hypothetical protein RL757_3028 [Bacteroidota bacterium]|jgi:poly-gamma-glutamate synthesis protein (capsule biosynthesis protein)